MPYVNVDYIADRLALIAKIGRDMPPSWDGAKITIPVISPCGEARIGKILPGRGLYLASDLKSVGITKKIPYVFEHSPTMRLMEKLKSERTAIAAAALITAASFFSRKLLTGLGPIVFGTLASYDAIINARSTTGVDVTVTKTSITTVASAWSGLFDTGGLPVAGAYTATPGAVCTNATTGALSFGIPNPAGANEVYLLTFGYTSTVQINMAILADLLVQVGSIAVAGAGATVSSAALTRYTNGNGVMMTWEVTTALGATPANLTVSYTNQAGTAAQSTGAQALTVSAIVGRLQPIATGPYSPLASGDYGVRAVATATTSANMTAGALALNLYFPLAFVPGVAANAYIERDSTNQIDGLSIIQDDSSDVLGCLTLYVLSNGATSGVVTAFMRTVAG